MTTSPDENRTKGSRPPEDDRTVRVAWARTTAEDGGKIRGRLLTVLVRLLTDAPEAVTLDGAGRCGNDFLFTIRVPRARLVEAFGKARTSERPYQVPARKTETSGA